MAARQTGLDGIKVSILDEAMEAAEGYGELAKGALQRQAMSPGTVFFRNRDAAEHRRQMVSKALEKMYPKKKERNGGPGGCSLSSYCYILEISPDRVVFEREGQQFGATYAVDDAKGEVLLERPVLVEQVWTVAKPKTSKEEDDEMEEDLETVTGEGEGQAAEEDEY